MKLETIAVHGGYSPEPTTKAVAVPIYQTTSYAFDDTQHGADLFDLKVEGNIYTRIMNPTTAVLEQRVAEMEGGIAALGLSSGMAAINYAIQTIAESGDNIISTSSLYDAKSAGYSFGTDMSKEEASLENINKNINDFISSLNGVPDLSACVS